jgi:3-methyladenine DNA glycosylase AlkD
MIFPNAYQELNMVWTTADLVGYIQNEFTRLADPSKAGPMAAYMKTDMPFYGIQKPDRIPVYRQMKKNFQPFSRKQYEDAVLALWKQSHREEKYAAIEYARQHKEFTDVASFPLYERLIREGAWWDLVDDIATSIITDTYLLQRQKAKPFIEAWIDDDDMWIRRTALLSHNHHKTQTDSKQLFKHALKCCHETEFFIRKAIGWALREYSYANPAEVMKFIDQNKEKLSPLSVREASKGLIRKGHLPEPVHARRMESGNK